jgi:malate dehydrogenase (oxaloacetate-decarboxylating)(NADP+)
MHKDNKRREALLYHAKPTPGKIAVVPTKKYATQRDLSLAYSPGVAEPCLEIAKDVNNVYKYTSKGNLVAVISNGTAVLGLGEWIQIDLNSSRIGARFNHDINLEIFHC